MRRRKAYTGTAKNEFSKETAMTGGRKNILRPCRGNTDTFLRFISKKCGHRTKTDAASVMMKWVMVLSL